MRFKVGDEVIVLYNPNNDSFINNHLLKIYIIKSIKEDSIYFQGEATYSWFLESELEFVTELTKVLYK